MNLADNKFVLSKIENKNNRIYLHIDLEADVETKQLFLTNYFEGLYIGKGARKYNIYTQVVEGQIIGELLFESIERVEQLCEENLQQLWIRNRIGNTYIDSTIQINLKKELLYLGYNRQYYFVTKENYYFYFTKLNTKLNEKNPLSEVRIINNATICVEDDSIVLKAEVDKVLLSIFKKETMRKKISLAWKDLKNKKKYFFHYEEIIDGNIKFKLTNEEIKQMNVLEANLSLIEWLFIDEKGREYKIYIEENKDFKEIILPTNDYYARIIISEEKNIQMQLNTTIFFEYSELTNGGNGFVINYRKRSYSLEVVNIIAQRVNTELEYNLPFEILEESEKHISYEVSLDFNIDKEEFKNGIHQIWIEIKDGIYVDRYPLKLFRNMPIKENTYIISKQPYTVIGNSYYNCLFYNDTSNNLKINIVQKSLKIQIEKIVLKENNIRIPFSVITEPYFTTISSVLLVTRNNEEIKVACKIYNNVKSNIAELEMTIPIFEINSNNIDSSFSPRLCFDERIGLINIEDNYNRPTLNNRDGAEFTFIEKNHANDVRRIWGKYQNNAYWIGITEDIRVLKVIGLWLYEDDKLCIRIDWIELEEKWTDKEITLYLRNKITGEEVEFDREYAVENEIIFRISLDKVMSNEFLIIARLPNGMISYLEATSVGSILFSNKTIKKVRLMKNENNALTIKVEPLLLFENTDKIDECNLTIEKARLEIENSNRKIWLIGENYGLSARDNGLAFFEYCMEHLNSVDAEIYFVSKKENEDALVLDKYKNNVIEFDSIQHIYLDELAEFYIVSHGVRDVMPSLYHNAIGKYRKDIIYLQHGITAMKINGINNNSYGGSISKVIVSSEQEKRLFIENRQFMEEELVITGFSRYDKLSKTNKEELSNYIWIMPTWRDWLMKSENEFLESDFYKNYCQILANETLISKLRIDGIKIVFSLHIEFEKYRHYFNKYENDVVHITNMHEMSISKRIKECLMIITDYSSIIFDVVYLGKPAAFFQFDQETYMKHRGSYVDLNTELPGKVMYEPEALIDEIQNKIKTKFVVEDEFKGRVKKYFDYRDSNNSKRIYEEIIKCRQEIANENSY